MSLQQKSVGVVAAVVAGLILPSLATAQGVSQAAYNRLLDRVASLEAQQTSYYEEGPYYDGGFESDYTSGEFASGEFGGCESCGGSGCDSCAGGYCGDSCYTGCGTCCCSGFYALYENVIAQPFFSHDTAYFGNGTVDSVSDGNWEHSFDWNSKYSPRVEIGFQPECGLGIRARYWYYDNDATFSQLNDTQLVDAQHSLSLDVTDLEVTARKCDLLLSGGIRYARLDQDYSAQGYDVDVLLDEVRTTRNFEGVGPTLGVESSSCTRWCGFGLFAKARGSLLYGESSSSFATQVGSTVSTGVVSHERDDLLAIAELQIGVDWQRSSHWGTLYLSAALEAQYWHNAGSAAAGFVDNVVTYYEGAGYSADMGFLGGTFGAGLLW